MKGARPVDRRDPSTKTSIERSPQSLGSFIQVLAGDAARPFIKYSLDEQQ